MEEELRSVGFVPHQLPRYEHVFHLVHHHMLLLAVLNTAVDTVSLLQAVSKREF